MSTSKHQDVSLFKRLSAKAKKYLGWATADREVEAEGVAEVRDGPDPSAGTVGEAKEDVKANYQERLDADLPPPGLDGGPPE